MKIEGPRPAKPAERRAGSVRDPRILVFDSGLGGLTVFSEIMRLRPAADYVFAADDAAFPYGRIYGPELVARVAEVMERLIALYEPDIVAIACNTASTLVLPDLRARFPDRPFVGTVPAVKPAAALSRSKLISVLATPGTVQRDYTHDLIREHAAHCAVTLVGSTALASIAEAFMRGESVSDRAIAGEIAPCFVAEGDRRTDAIALACTHYPLLLAQFERLAPWSVVWIDPAPAIARRVDAVLAERGFAANSAPDVRKKGAAVFTSGRPAMGALAALLERWSLVSADDAPRLPYRAAGA
jgi:glutamate racemase